jgi:hypothetical protein
VSAQLDDTLLNPGGPPIKLTIYASDQEAPITQVSATLELPKSRFKNWTNWGTSPSSQSYRDVKYEFPMVTQKNPLSPGGIVSQTIIIIAGDVDTAVDYPVVVSGTFMDGGKFSYETNVTVSENQISVLQPTNSSQAFGAISVDSANASSTTDLITLYVRNIGPIPEVVSSAYVAGISGGFPVMTPAGYLSSQVIMMVPLSPQVSILPNSVGSVTISMGAINIVSGRTYTVKLVCQDGTKISVPILGS